MNSIVMTFFIVLVGLFMICPFTAYLITLAMLDAVNKKKNYQSQLSLFNCSWVSAFREYRLLYPNGVYTKLLYFIFGLIGLLIPIFVCLLFVTSKILHPSL